MDHRGKKKSLKYLHLPNEDSMDKGDNSIIAEINNSTSVSDNNMNTQQISDSNTSDAPMDSKLGFFENRHLERVLLTNNLTAQNHVDARSDSIGGRNNNHTSVTEVSKQTIHKPSYSQNSTVSKMQYQDFENSSNPFNAAKNDNSVLAVNNNNAKLTKNVSSMVTASKGVEVDDLETVNSNDKPIILPVTSLISPSSSIQPTIQTHNSRNPSASSRHLGDRNDWGNSSPAVNSENKHYWDKKKKTKANINNVNHRMKDFSSIFFISAMKHDIFDEDDIVKPISPLPSLGKSKLLNESPQQSIDNNSSVASEQSHEKNNITLLHTQLLHNTPDVTDSSSLSVTNTTTSSTGQHYTNDNNTDISTTTLSSNDNKTTETQQKGSVVEGIAKSLHVSNVTFTTSPINSTSSSSDKQDGSGVVVVVERQPPTIKEKKIINSTTVNAVKIADVDESSILPMRSNENKTKQESNQTDFTEHLLKQLQSLSSKKHLPDKNTSTTTSDGADSMVIVKPKQTSLGTETTVKDSKLFFVNPFYFCICR